MKRVKKQTKKSKKAAPRRGESTSGAGSSNPQSGTGSEYRDPAPTMRFDATIHTRKKSDPDAINRINIDRVPDSDGLVRGLLTAADCVRLLDQGFEVRLHQAHAVKPLDPKLIETNESVERWLDEKLNKLRRREQ